MKPFCYVVTGKEMQRYDRNTITKLGVPALILMEQAAMAAVQEIVRLFPKKQENVLILAGSGNNGADAMAVARLLAEKGYQVTVYPVNQIIPKEGSDNLPLLQYNILQKTGVSIVTELPPDTYDIVVDGIFGVGLSRPVEGKTADILLQVSDWKAFKLALDVPSGIDSDTGKVLGCGFRADCTVTFGFLKLGLCLYPGADYAGRVVVGEIGITPMSFFDEPPVWKALSGKPADHMPPRPKNGHKGSFGKVLVVGGSEEVGGAPYLAALGALRTGCGMVRICTHRNHRQALTGLLPEALLDTYESSSEAIEALEKGLPWADVILLGPGLGTSRRAEDLLEKVMMESRLPLVLDADGLNLLADTCLGAQLAKLQSDEDSRRVLILTPHILEMARLSGASTPQVQDRNSRVLEAVSETYQATVIQKDARTLIMEEGKNGYINLYGNSGMATAGSGDLLAGIVASLKAQGMGALESAALGVCLHAKAGDLGAADRNEYSLTAGDIGEALCEVLKER